MGFVNRPYSLIQTGTLHIEKSAKRTKSLSAHHHQNVICKRLHKKRFPTRILSNSKCSTSLTDIMVKCSDCWNVAELFLFDRDMAISIGMAGGNHVGKTFGFLQIAAFSFLSPIGS
mmetsp:Transcript_45057/g.95859  ORF Transcript_45057/g.95859 Transcript_45057/m.95859 type:complete len:116 (+) Transcript_45057:393-740(+)